MPHYTDVSGKADPLGYNDDAIVVGAHLDRSGLGQAQSYLGAAISDLHVAVDAAWERCSPLLRTVDPAEVAVDGGVARDAAAAPATVTAYEQGYAVQEATRRVRALIERLDV